MNTKQTASDKRTILVLGSNGFIGREFVKELLTGLTNPPGYFPKNVLMNIQGYESLDLVMERGKKAFNPAEFEVVANETRALILDTRRPEDFAKGFIPNSINIGLESNFAM